MQASSFTDAKPNSNLQELYKLPPQGNAAVQFHALNEAVILNNTIADSSNTMEAFQSIINPIIDSNRIVIIGDHSHKSPLMHCTLALIEDHLVKNPSERIAICPEALFAGVPVAQNLAYESKLYRQLAIKHPHLEFYGLETSQCEARQNKIYLLSNYAKEAIDAEDLQKLKKFSTEIFGFIEESRKNCSESFSEEMKMAGFKSEIRNANDVLQLLTGGDTKSVQEKPLTNEDKELAQIRLEKLITVASLYSAELYGGAEANRLDTNGDFANVIPFQDTGISKIIVIAGENHCYETDQSKSIQQHIQNSPNGKNQKIATILFNGGSQFAQGQIQDPDFPQVKSVSEHLTFPGQLMMDTMKDSPKMQEYAAMLSENEPSPEPIFTFSNKQSYCAMQ